MVSYASDETEETGMGWIFGTCGDRGEVHTGVWLGKGNLKARDHLRDLDVDVPSIRQRNGFRGRGPN
jgi:hypothetical protein